MSAENTNVEKQAKQHRPALWGMGTVVVIALLLLLAYLFAVTTPEVDEVEALISAPAEESN